MADNRVMVTVPKIALQGLCAEVTRMIKPKTFYNPSNELYFKGVIAEQIDRAERIKNIVEGMISGKHL